MCVLEKPNSLAGLRAVSWKAGWSPWGALGKAALRGGFGEDPSFHLPQECECHTQSVPVTAARRVICPCLAVTALQECWEAAVLPRAVEAAGCGDSRDGCSVQLSRLAAFQPAQRSQAALEAQRAGILCAVGTPFIQNRKQSLP